ncbi:MAG: hypothetical protein ONB23_00790 [candidate division KSB1 bacterium]|nr:hypothetical protein [candidate division KSB1 bacterium]
MEPWFLEFIVRVKNLRGVLYLPDVEEDTALAALRWIGSKFRYRDIGYDAAFSSERGKKVARRLAGKPYVPVDFPSPEIQEISKSLTPEGADVRLWRALGLASLFACPLVVAGSESSLPRQAIVFRAFTDSPLGAGSAKFHLRVCDYAAVDWFAELTRAVLSLSPGEGERERLQELMRSRRELALRDGEKRFWRLKCENGAPAVVLTLDPLAFLPEAGHRALLEALRTSGPATASLFSLVPAFCVVPGVTVAA